MTRDEAESVALQVAAEHYRVASDDTLVIDPDKSEEREVGWLLWPQSKRFLDTDNYDDEVVGVRPVFVERLGGEAALIAGDMPTNFEVHGSPAPDFPGAAWLMVPLGVLTHAGVWGGAWILIDGVLNWLDRMPVVWMLALTAGIGIAAILVVGAAVEYAGFKNLHRAIPIGMAATGVVLGESAFWVYFAEGAPVGELIAGQEFDYLLIRLAGIVVSVAGASAVGRGDRESKSLWRGD